MRLVFRDTRRPVPVPHDAAPLYSTTLSNLIEARRGSAPQAGRCLRKKLDPVCLKEPTFIAILILGAGPYRIIGQACEFDYSGAQACKALREEGLPGGAGQLQPGHHHDRPHHG